MRSHRSFLYKAFLFLAVTFRGALEGAVIVDDAAITPLFGFGTTLTLTKSIPSGQGLFAIDIMPAAPSQFNFSYFGIAEEYRLFAVVGGEAFDSSYVITNTPLVSNNGVLPGSSLQTFIPGESKLFAYWDDRTPFGGVPNSTDNFGWVEIAYTGSELVAASSATAIGGGIVVGTLIQTPEPTRAMLLCIGCGLILLTRHRRK